jgi:hypothetical protein
MEDVSLIATLAKAGAALLFAAAGLVMVVKTAKRGTMPRLGLSREERPTQFWAGIAGIATLFVVLAVLFYEW